MNYLNRSGVYRRIGTLKGLPLMHDEVKDIVYVDGTNMLFGYTAENGVRQLLDKRGRPVYEAESGSVFRRIRQKETV